jgi:hypothetical protein
MDKSVGYFNWDDAFNKSGITDSALERLETYGYVVIDNFLPKELHDLLLAELIKNSSTIHYQIRTNHYANVFKSSNRQLPDENEAYISRFQLLNDREKLPNLKKAFYNYIAPTLKAASKNRAKFALYPLAVRMNGGDLYRAHQCVLRYRAKW